MFNQTTYMMFQNCDDDLNVKLEKATNVYDETN